MTADERLALELAYRHRRLDLIARELDLREREIALRERECEQRQSLIDQSDDNAEMLRSLLERAHVDGPFLPPSINSRGRA